MRKTIIREQFAGKCLAYREAIREDERLYVGYYPVGLDHRVVWWRITIEFRPQPE